MRLRINQNRERKKEDNVAARLCAACEKPHHTSAAMKKKKILSHYLIALCTSERDADGVFVVVSLPMRQEKSRSLWRLRLMHCRAKEKCSSCIIRERQYAQCTYTYKRL